MIRFLGKLMFGHYRRHRVEALLCLLGVALGVAVVIAIDSAVSACVRSFSGAVESFAERSTHGIFSDQGEISDETYIALLKKNLPFPLAPVIDRGVLAENPAQSAPGQTAPGQSGYGESAAGQSPITQFVVGRLIGVDVFSERALRSATHLQSSLTGDDFRKFMTEPGQVVIVAPLAEKLHLAAGSALRLAVGGRRVTANVTAVIRLQGVGAAQMNNLLIADLATAQELTESIGKIDRIDTRLDSPAQEAALAAALPAGLSLISTRQQGRSLDQLIASYRLNLNALSLMASFVAVFIVYNSMLISVQQRVTSLGILRCLGASRTQMAGIYVMEAAMFAIAGAAVGILGGWELARLMVGFVSTTINDLYAAVQPGPVGLDWMAVLKGCGVSAGSCLVGTIVPLYRAARVPPVNAFRETARRDASAAAATWLLIVGAGFLALAAAIDYLPGRSPLVGFAMAGLIGLGFALACPFLTRMAAALLAAVAKPMQQLPLRMAASGVGRSLGITGIAVAATMLAMSMNVGVRTMVGSFRGALGVWLGQRFAADVFVAPDLLVNHKIDAVLDPRVREWVRRQPEVSKEVDYRGRDVPFGGKPTLMSATDVQDTLATLPVKSWDDRRRPFDPGSDILISEPLAGRTGLAAGDVAALQTPRGERRMKVYAVFYDFGTERGQIIMDRSAYAREWGDDAITSVHVTLKPGVNAEQIAGRWQEQLGKDYPIAASSFGQIRAEAMKVFDRTFKVTEVLTWLAGAVAFCGLAGSLLALAMARQKDYSVLAAIGMSGRQTAVWVLAQGLLIAWTAAVAAAAAGTVLAYVLAYVIQLRSFGWSIPTSPQPKYWLDNLLLATAAAIVATIYPAYRLRAVPPAGVLREE